ncbi:beta-lactamase family protein [Paenibacillus polysaccharolyticus]|uniref:serine hydrolase domain-containing protein n=1 Tax=Paenibacillus TaxID=44249 RepID=UPI00209F493B|nr:serine hydrolase domain-containing protein [Paenibacillus polysaccharolyticus]MCP1132750.1 beta-lactamase family protein [Paenibacillus polysaccharolyticus]
MLTLVFFFLLNSVGFASSSPRNLEDAINSYITEELKESNIPGISIAVVHDQFEYSRGYGVRDNGNQDLPIDKQTFFELGSNSKAFTGIALLQLAKQGKLNLNENIKSYLPWFQAHLQAVEKDIKIQQLLYHSSGIANNSITQIPVSTGPDALKETVRSVIPIELVHNPGENYEYATLNYDIIGLIVQEVSGMSYEDYMIENVFKPLGLYNTFPLAKIPKAENQSPGHKLGLFGTILYNGPTYRGNTPAGYIVSNAEDMIRWMKIQLDLISISEFKGIIEQSHIPDKSIVQFKGDPYYASGWEVYSFEGEQLEHSGANPGFSSYVLINKGKKLGVTVMANMNTEAAFSMAMGIEQLLLGNSPEPSRTGMFTILHKIMQGIILISTCSVVIVSFLLVRMYNQKQRVFQVPSPAGWIKLLLIITSFALIVFATYFLPKIYQGYSWTFLWVWAPSSLTIGAIALVVALSVLMIYLSFSILFPSEKHMKSRI